MRSGGKFEEEEYMECARNGGLEGIRKIKVDKGRKRKDKGRSGR